MALNSLSTLDWTSSLVLRAINNLIEGVGEFPDLQSQPLHLRLVATGIHLLQILDVLQWWRPEQASVLAAELGRAFIADLKSRGGCILFIDRFLKEHLFGDIFGRDNLDFQSREIATISALANMKGVNPQLESHFSIGLNTGLTKTQMRGLISVLEARVGKEEAANAKEISAKVLSNRAK